MYIKEYPHLTPQEAQEKYLHLANALFTQQWHKQFYIRDPRPEQYLKYELTAFWEGWIDEFHGWNDPVGQIVNPILDGVKDILETTWKNVIKPGVNAIVSSFKWIWDSTLDWILTIWDKVKGIYTSITDLWDFIVHWLWSRIKEIGTNISNMWSDIVSTVTSKFEALTQQMAALPQTIAGAFSNAITDVVNALYQIPNLFVDAFAAYVDQKIEQSLWFVDNVLVPAGERFYTHIEPKLHELTVRVHEYYNALVGYLHNLGAMTPERASDAMPNVMMLAFTGLAGLGTAYVIGELLHPLKEIGLGHLAAMLWKATNYDLIMGAVIGALATAAFKIPLGYFYNSMFTPKLPTTSEAGEFWRRALISDDEFLQICKYQGFNDEWARKFLETKKELPSVDQGIRMYWRGVLTDDDLKKLIHDLGYRDKYAEGFYVLREALPSPSDLVRFVVREVALMPKDYPTPEFFIDAMRKWGYSDYWARAYWWSHWELPAFGQLQDAYFRGIITEEELKKFIQWHDYSPTPRPGISKSDLEIMYQLIFRMPDKLDARFMRRWGIIDTETHKELLKMTGLHPDWLDRVALGEKMQLLIDERSEAKRVFKDQLLWGMISMEIYRAKLKEIMFTDEEISLAALAAEESFKVRLLKDAIDALKYNYRLGRITLEELQIGLVNLGLSPERVEKLVAVEQARAIETRRENLEDSIYIYGRPTVIRRYKEGLLTDSELETELKMIGYTDRQIPRLKIIARLERDFDFAMTVLKYVKIAYRKGKIDDTRFIEILRNFGFVDEKIMLELQLLKLAYSLGIEEEVGS